ncbi:MAG: hypothetical protein JW966_06980 [Anaerolineae bacterium]|nr:hypothetical protein [Anaerolineae bacterium]
MSEDRIIALINSHLERYPQAEYQDVYKLLHQAAFGPGHLITSRKAAREYLDNEITKLAPAPDEPLVENIHTNGQIVRLHLRPYLALQGKPKPLLDAFIASAKHIEDRPYVGTQSRPDMVARWWAVFHDQCQPGGVYAGRFVAREVMLFGRVRGQEGWPAVHHSPAYDTAYRPAYRVLTRSEAEALCTRLNVPFEVI